jgi:hypothetical protein
MSPQDFDAALHTLGWKAADFARKAGLTSQSVWRWRDGQVPIPAWAALYLEAMIEIQRLHARFVAVDRARDAAAPGEAQAPK